MGQAECKGELVPDIDICKLGKCVTKIEGRASNSASPSDIWRLSINSGVTFNQVPIHCAWLKVFVANPDEDMRPTDGLQYERLVYKKIVGPLVEKRVCPNFVRYLSSSDKCTYKDLVAILDKQGIDEEHLLRSLCHMTTQTRKFSKRKRPQRPAINDRVTSSQYKDIKKAGLEPKHLRFGLLLTQDRRVVSLRDWVQRDVSLPDYACMMLQLTAALRAMELSRFVHNDLHLNNVLVELNSTSCNVRYVMDGYEFGICTNFRVMIFDFDRAVVDQLGENTLTRRHACYAQEFKAGRDLSSVLALLFKRCDKEQGRLLEDAFKVSAAEFMKELRGHSPENFSTFRRGRYKLLDGTTATQSNAFIKFDCAPIVRTRASMVDAMKVFHTKVAHTCNAADADFNYVCNADMFSHSGRLLV